MSMWIVVLNVGLPLWILQATPAAPALVAVLYAANTVLAVLFQARVSRLGPHATRAPRGRSARPASCSRRAACAWPAGGRQPRALHAAAVVAVAVPDRGELLKVSAAWQITFTLAPPARAAEFFATYGLGRVAFQICGPVLVTAVVLALGSAGWLLLAAVFVAAGSVARPPLARRGRARPVVARRPPRERPRSTPLLAPPDPGLLAGAEVDDRRDQRAPRSGRRVTSSLPPSVLIRSVSLSDSLPLIVVVAGKPPTAT